MRNLSEHLIKINHYTDLEIKILAERGVKINLFCLPWFFLARPLLRFIESYFLMKGFKDGIRGFLLSVNSMFTEFIKYAKYWEEYIAKNTWK